MKSFLNRVANRKDSGGLVNKIVKVGPYTVKVEACVGDGGFATIYRVRDNGTNTAYALKHMQMRGEPDALEDCQTEVATMKKLRDHPHVLTLRAVAFLGPKGQEQEAYLLLDLCTDNLVEYMKQRNNLLSDSTVLQIFHSVCKAVAIMHQQEPPLSHRDLKAENVLLHNNGSWVLCDFGSTTSWSGVYQSTNDVMMGEEIIRKYTTPAYRAPEMYDLYSREVIGPQADMWALGVLLFFMAYGRLPFDGEAKLQVLNANFRIPAQPARPAEVVDLIHGLLVAQPSKRLDIDAVLWRLERLASGILVKPPAPAASQSASPAESGFAFDELDEVAGPPGPTRGRSSGYAAYAAFAPESTAEPAPFIADFGIAPPVSAGPDLLGSLAGPGGSSGFADFEQARLATSARRGFADFDAPSRTLTPPPPAGNSANQGFANFDAAPAVSSTQHGFANFDTAPDLSSSQGGFANFDAAPAVQPAFPAFDSQSRGATPPPPSIASFASPERQRWGSGGAVPGPSLQTSGGSNSLLPGGAAERQGAKNGGLKAADKQASSSSGAFWATDVAALSSTAAREVAPSRTSAAPKPPVQAREAAAEPDTLLGSTFAPAARGPEASGQGSTASRQSSTASGAGGTADVARLQRQVTDQQRQIEALAQALQERDATIRQLQAATADQSASLKRLQSQLSSVTLGSEQWPTQERKWDAFDSGIPAGPGGSEQGTGPLHSSLRNSSLPNSRSASPATFTGQIGTSKRPPMVPATQDPFVASTASEMSFDEEEDAFVPLTQLKVTAKGKHRRTTSEPTPIESWGLTADWPPS